MGRAGLSIKEILIRARDCATRKAIRTLPPSSHGFRYSRITLPAPGVAATKQDPFPRRLSKDVNCFGHSWQGHAPAAADLSYLTKRTANQRELRTRDPASPI